MAPKTLFEKIWDEHVVYDEPGQPALLYVDLHLVHEVTSAQAFEGLRLAGRKVRRPDLTVATADHNVPTRDRLNIKDEVSRRQIEALRTNAAESGIQLYDIDSDRTIPFNSMRAGCTTNYIPAGGVMTAPAFGHGCVCN